MPLFHRVRLCGQYYTQENNSYKRAVWQLAGGGTALVLLGLAIYDYNPSYVPVDFKTAGNALMVYGSVLIPSNVILFIVSSRNKNFADVKGLKFKLELEKAVELQNTNIVYNYYPALSLKMNLK